jgi:N-methylhydantoinase A
VQLVSPIDAGQLERVFAELEEELKALVETGRTSGSEPELRRYVRMRYEWQRNELEIPVPSGSLDDALVQQVTKDFEKRYESRYGPAALLPGARFEIVNLRAEALQETGLGAGAKHVAANGAGGQKRSRAVAFERGAAAQEVAVHAGTDLEPGSDVDGPAVIDLPTTGVVVPPGSRAARTDRGDFVLTFRR